MFMPIQNPGPSTYESLGGTREAKVPLQGCRSEQATRKGVPLEMTDPIQADAPHPRKKTRRGGRKHKKRLQLVSAELQPRSSEGLPPESATQTLPTKQLRRPRRLNEFIDNAIKGRPSRPRQQKDVLPAADHKRPTNLHSMEEQFYPELLSQFEKRFLRLPSRLGRRRLVPVKKSTPLKKIILRDRQQRIVTDITSSHQSKLSSGVASPSSLPAHDNDDEHSAAGEWEDDMPHYLRDSPLVHSSHWSSANDATSAVNEESEVASGYSDDPQWHVERAIFSVRPYICQVLSECLDVQTRRFLTIIAAAKKHESAGFHARGKLFIAGFRECSKALNRSRPLLCVMVATNLEVSQSKGGLDSIVIGIQKLCEEKGVLLIFTLSRNGLGRACGLSTRQSCVAILSAALTYATELPVVWAGISQLVANLKASWQKRHRNLAN